MRIAVFGSGGGSNFEAICEAIDGSRLDARVVLVLSDRPSVGILERAARRGIPTAIVNPADFSSESEYSSALSDLLAASGADFIALAGYLKKIPAEVTEAYRNRIVNIHPALLPWFGGKGMYGARVHRAVLERRALVSGATVHLVDEAYDTGPVVAQSWVEVHDDDTPESLAARVLVAEHRLYPAVLQLFAQGRVRIHEEGVQIETQTD